MVWTTLTLQDRKEAGYPGRDDADLINILSSIEDADIALIFVEQGNGVKVSWRAQPGFDVSRVAQQFGGGGHRAAAGAQIEGSMPDIREKVLEATRMSLHGQLEQNRKAPVNRKDFAGDKI
jgi:phosphoesterase RecJ-like protein